MTVMAYNPLSKIGSYNSILIYTKINLKTNGENRKHFLSRMATNRERMMKLENPFGKYHHHYAKEKLSLAFLNTHIQLANFG